MIFQFFKGCTLAEDLSGVADDCTLFLRCVYGNFYSLSCPTGTNFDYIRKLCDLPSKAVCFKLNQANSVDAVAGQSIKKLPKIK